MGWDDDNDSSGGYVIFNRVQWWWPATTVAAGATVDRARVDTFQCSVQDSGYFRVLVKLFKTTGQRQSTGSFGYRLELWSNLSSWLNDTHEPDLVRVQFGLTRSNPVNGSARNRVRTDTTSEAIYISSELVNIVDLCISHYSKICLY
ncbi:hypothetical protein HanIR_Chr12g0601811 [Helianthus annuus]|nr:hypothetical protein HanIR_Chr12g0601811 [Helianthus annuus]